MDRRGSDAVRCELAILGRPFTLCRRVGLRLADFGRGPAFRRVSWPRVPFSLVESDSNRSPGLPILWVRLKNLTRLLCTYGFLNRIRLYPG